MWSANCVVWLLSVVKNAHVFWTRGAELTDGNVVVTLCGRPEPYRHFEHHVRPWLAFFSVCVVPALVIVVCNVAIVRQLARLRNVRRVAELPPAGSTDQRSVTEPSRAADEVRGRRVGGVEVGAFAQTSMMCVAASLTFLACVPPSVALTAGHVYWSHRRAYAVARTVNHQLACLNHAVNFILYCVAGRRFRAELAAVFRREHSTTTPPAPVCLSQLPTVSQAASHPVRTHSPLHAVTASDEQVACSSKLTNIMESPR